MRLLPPKILTGHGTPDDFYPGDNIAEFVDGNFLNENSKLYNHDHIHLTDTNIGFF